MIVDARIDANIAGQLKCIAETKEVHTKSFTEPEAVYKNVLLEK